MRFSRRNFLRISGAGIAATQAPGLLASERIRHYHKPESELPFQLGIASYTFREFPLEDTIDMTSRLQIPRLCLKSMHMPLDASREEILERAAKVRQAGIGLYGAGVVYMKDRQEVDHAFEYAKTAGMEVIVGVPEHELLEYCNRKVQETGIALAIHNHGPGDERYPSPESAYEKINQMDPKMGLCVDIGHTARLGLDPSREVQRFLYRVHDIHIKDEDQAAPEGKTCEIGHGVIDIPGFLRMLVNQNYSRVVSFEYEKDGKDPLPGLAESVGYVRGDLDMLA